MVTDCTVIGERSITEDFLKFRIDQYVGKTGAPGTIRTCDPQYRKLCQQVFRDRLQETRIIKSI